jgi:hypothetical protein
MSAAIATVEAHAPLAMAPSGWYYIFGPSVASGASMSLGRSCLCKALEAAFKLQVQSSVSTWNSSRCCLSHGLRLLSSLKLVLLAAAKALLADVLG